MLKLSPGKLRALIPVAGTAVGLLVATNVQGATVTFVEDPDKAVAV